MVVAVAEHQLVKVILAFQSYRISRESVRILIVQECVAMGFVCILAMAVVVVVEQVLQATVVRSPVYSGEGQVIIFPQGIQGSAWWPAIQVE